MKRMLTVVLTSLLVLCGASAARAQAVLSSTTCPGTGCDMYRVQGAGSIGFEVDGPFSGTLTFEQRIGASTNWVALTMYPYNSTTGVTSTTSTGMWTGSVAGASEVRVRFSVYTSGTATIYAATSSAKLSNPASSGTTITGGACTNQMVSAISTSGVPTCTTLTSAYADTTIAKTGTDINTSNQVTVTHLASPLPAAQGGTANAFFAVSGPTTSTKTFTLPDASSTVLTSNALVTAAQGGTANGFFAVAGPTTSTKTFTFPDASASVLTSNAAVTVAQGGTGLATLTAHALYVGNGTSAPSAVAVCGTGTYVRGATTADPICSTLTLPNTASAGQYLIATTSNTVIAVAPAVVHANPADQTGNATATFKMNGLGSAAAPCTITPVATGRVVFTVSGQLVQSTTADGVTWKLAEGTGTAPANAAAATGTVISATNTWTGLTGELNVPFSVTSTATGLALSTAVWFDLQVADVTGGTASVKNVDCTAYEM